MNQFEAWYIDLVKEVLEEGSEKGDRTGTGTLSTFDAHYRHNIIKHGYPILSSRELKPHQPVVEMSGFLKGITNSNWYHDRGCPYWNLFGAKRDVYQDVRKQDHELANEYCSDKGKNKPTSPEYRERYLQLEKLGLQEGTKLITDYGIDLYHHKLTIARGELGPIYGWLWRNWRGLNGKTIDQIEYLMKTLREDPENRRVVVSAWDPAYMPDPAFSPSTNAEKGKQCLTACHYSFVVSTLPIPKHIRIEMLEKRLHDVGLTTLIKSEQYERELENQNIPKHYVNLSFTMRSNDVGIGLPANIQEYTWLCAIIGKSLNMVPRYVAYTGVDVHIYQDHISQLREVIRRYDSGETPREKVDFVIDQQHENLWDYDHHSLELLNYNPLPLIKFPIAV